MSNINREPLINHKLIMRNVDIKPTSDTKAHAVCEIDRKETQNHGK